MSGDNNEAIEAYDKYRTQVEEASDYIEHFDILETITNVGNDEVFTPAAVCRHILDALPEDVWKHPEYKWLNPFTKNGIFEREIAIRLNESLADQIPDEETRKKHILQEMIFSIGVTRFCSMVARRTLYYCAYANRADDGVVDPVDGHSVNGYAIGNGTWFNDEQGNIKTPTAEHYFGKDGKCVHCKISKDSKYTDESQIEHYAYEFIHFTNTTQHLSDLFGRQNMKFDVIIGNPPYQLNDGGSGASAKPIYNLFIDRAKELKPRYLAMIIPARWYAGGKGLDTFRSNMLKDHHIEKLVDYPNGKDCFPNFEIAGGVCYFVRNADYDGPCEVTNIVGNEVKSVQIRPLNEFKTFFVRNNDSIDLVRKIVKQTDKAVSSVKSRNYFTIPTTKDGPKEKTDNKDVKVLSSKGVYYINKKELTDSDGILDKYKVIITYAMSGGNKPSTDGKYQVISSLQTLTPGESCSETYLVLNTFESEEMAHNFESYVKTKFFRFFLLQALSSIHITKTMFSLIPDLDYHESWTDKKLNEKFGLTQSEIDLIDSCIKEY